MNHEKRCRQLNWHYAVSLYVLVAQSCLTLCDPMDHSYQGPLSMGILKARMLEWVAMLSSRGSSQQRDETRSPTLQADSLPSEPPGKPKNTGVGSLSLLQGNFRTQELNQGLLHCRWILYQLSYPGSPTVSLLDFKNPINRHFLEFMWCGESILLNPSSEGFCSCFPIPPILLGTSQNSKSLDS